MVKQRKNQTLTQVTNLIKALTILVKTLFEFAKLLLY